MSISNLDSRLSTENFVSMNQETYDLLSFVVKNNLETNGVRVKLSPWLEKGQIVAFGEAKRFVSYLEEYINYYREIINKPEDAGYKWEPYRPLPYKISYPPLDRNLWGVREHPKIFSTDTTIKKEVIEEDYDESWLDE